MPTKQEFDGRIWPTILEFNENIDAQLTSKANFVFGASTLILIFVINKILAPEYTQLEISTKTAWAVLLIGSFFSSLISLMIVLPRIKILSKKKRIKEDVFYYKNIAQFYTREEYLKYLTSLPMNNKRISKAYANQIYSLATDIIPYKFKMLKLSGWCLITSIFITIILLII